MSKKQIEQLLAQIQEIKLAFEEIKSTSLTEVWLDSADIKIQFNFSDSKLYRLRKTNQIPHQKIGGTYHYPKSYFTTILLKKVKEKGM